MRIDEIRQVIQAETPKLDVQVADIPSSKLKRLTGHHDALAAVRRLKSTGTLDDEIRPILELELENAPEPLTLDAEAAIRLRGNLHSLRQRANAIDSALKGFVLDARQTQVVLGLPADIADLTALIEFLKEIDWILSNTIQEKRIGGHVKLAGFDRGSDWMNLDLGTLQAVAILGGMCSLIISVGNKALEFEKKREELKSLKLNNELRASLNEAIDEELQQYRHQTLMALLSDGGISDEEHELRLRYETAIEKLESLTERGMKILPSLRTPNELRPLFEGRPALSGVEELPRERAQLTEGEADTKEESQDDSKPKPSE